MVLNSHHERENFQVHLCCNFTPNFADARSLEIQIIRNRCWVYWQPKRWRRALGFCRSDQQKWPTAVAAFDLVHDTRWETAQETERTPESASLALDCAATEDPLWSPPQSVETAIVSEDCRMPITNMTNLNRPIRSITRVKYHQMTSVTLNNSPIQDYTHSDDDVPPTRWDPMLPCVCSLIHDVKMAYEQKN